MKNKKKKKDLAYSLLNFLHNSEMLVLVYLILQQQQQKIKHKHKHTLKINT
jgi:hypothetical protein